MIKIKELKNLSETEMKRLLEQNREKLRALRFDLVSGKVKNVREIRETKKTVARLLTLLKEKEIYGRERKK